MFIETNYNINRYFTQMKFPFILTDTGVYTGNQAPINRPNGFFWHHCLWVVEGEGIFEVDGEQFTLKKGEGFFSRKDVPHSYRDSGNGFVTAWFTFLGGDSLFQYHGVGNWFRFTVPPWLGEEAAELERYCKAQSDFTLRTAAGYSLVARFFSACFAEKASLVQRVDQYLETNFDQTISLDDVALAVGCNKFSLCRKYLNEKGCSVMEQLKKIRIAKAKRYLQFFDFSMSEVGKLCGFESPSYFGKTFKEETGMSPYKYKNFAIKNR